VDEAAVCLLDCKSEDCSLEVDAEAEEGDDFRASFTCLASCSRSDSSFVILRLGVLVEATVDEDGVEAVVELDCEEEEEEDEEAAVEAELDDTMFDCDVREDAPAC
jgi:hypothetical protein